MARTPVVVEKKKPKRTPVAVESEPVREPVLPTDDELNEVVGRVAKTPVPPLDEDGHRVCAFEDCGISFKPISACTSVEADRSGATEFYCSTEHAIAAHYKKNKLGTPPEKITRGAESVGRAAVKQEKLKARVEAEPRKLAKYGPLRAVKSIVKQGKGSLRVLFECDHEGSIGSRAKQGRCRKCRPAQENRVEVATPVKPKRTPVVEEQKSKRQPVKAGKPKRTPVKPPKKTRSKKGKK